MIEFKEGVVFSALNNAEVQYRVNSGVLEAFNATGDYWFKSSHNFDYFLSNCIVKINEPREGYYIPKSELDTEEKYNRAVEVFVLFGRNPYLNKGIDKKEFVRLAYKDGQGLILDYEGDVVIDYGYKSDAKNKKVKLTFDQLMAIGELKRKMNERENEFIESRELDIEMIKKSTGSGGCGGDSAFGFLNTSELPNSSKSTKKRNSRPKEAYRILESMGIEWDNVKGKWFKVSKEWL